MVAFEYWPSERTGSCLSIPEALLHKNQDIRSRVSCFEKGELILSCMTHLTENENSKKKNTKILIS